MSIPTPEQIDAYESAPSDIAAAIEGLSESQMQHVPGAGEWSIHEVIVHLADSEAVGFERLRRTIAEERPVLQAYDEDAWAKDLSYHIQDRDLALALFTLQRRSTAELLRTLSAETWERIGLHAERGEMSLHDIFDLYLQHGSIHLAQIERLKRSL